MKPIGLLCSIAATWLLAACASPPEDEPDGGVASGSSGCGSPAPFDALEEQSFDLDGQSRKYGVYYPPGYTGDRPLVPVFVFHGSGAEWWEDRAYFGVHWEPAVGEDGILIYAEASESSGWNWCAEQTADGCPDYAYFEALLERTKAELCIDPDRVVLTGFSRGAGMVNSLRCLMPDLIFGVAPVAGWQAHASECTTALPTWIAHAQNDSIVPWDPSSGPSGGIVALETALEANGCNGADDYEIVGPYPDMTSDKWCRAYNGCDQPLTYCDHADDHHYAEWKPEAIWEFFQAI